ncbi:hypothetical protein C8R41DRAFT_243282 [Lentinula lateritia]|uniref:Uncharacterized protein n=1 Tax=Lentinula lateritia TaxID=40482 RepID=A0ABQ8VKW6_9AGAR|nr:hypothetical protein C8R41DRAFT_243282 [Lentinula lateritia]
MQLIKNAFFHKHPLALALRGFFEIIIRYYTSDLAYNFIHLWIEHRVPEGIPSRLH